MLKFHHAPWSRGSSILWLLEELGVDYEFVIRDMRVEGGLEESYREIQPHKKVPAIDHDGTVVTERAAIALYLAETFTDVGLSVAPDEPNRAMYLTWMVYTDSVFDPAICAHAHGLAYESNDYPFGLFDDMVANVERHLTRHPFAAGDRFTAADTQLASGIDFTMNAIHVLPERSAFKDYLARIAERPAYLRAKAIDQEQAMRTPFFQAMAQKGS